MKKKKTKYITAALVFVLLSICNIFISVMLHKIFSKTPGWMQFEPLIASVQTVIHIKGARLIFLAIETFIVLGIIAAQLTRATAYRSDLVKVTDDIYIPQGVGENQYGCARFYTKDEINKVFTVVKISKADPAIQKLIAHGYDDLDFIK